MKVYRVELMIIDHDGVGDDITTTIESQRYPNDCLSPRVVSIESREIGKWQDSHPLNQNSTWLEAFTNLFKRKK